MAKGNHGPYPAELRARLVELVRSGRTPEEVARQYEPTAQAIRNWVAQADRDAKRRGDGLTTDEKQELARLRRENKARGGEVKRRAGVATGWAHRPSARAMSRSPTLSARWRLPRGAVRASRGPS